MPTSKRPRIATPDFRDKIKLVCNFRKIDLHRPDGLANILGVTPRQVTSLLNGTCDWALHHLDTFATHIGVTTDQLRHLPTNELLKLLIKNKEDGGGQ